MTDLFPSLTSMLVLSDLFFLFQGVQLLLQFIDTNNKIQICFVISQTLLKILHADRFRSGLFKV